MNGQDEPNNAFRQTRFESTLEANRFDKLSRDRIEQRAIWESLQASNPSEFVGTCMEMCPEYERHEREAHFDGVKIDKALQPGEHVRIDHGKAVKKYHRPAAGNEAPLPEDVRPPPILRKTMDYLLDSILDRSIAAFSDKHKFVRDRTRSIRQDIIVQQRAIHREPDWLLTVVRLHEEIARFHILSGHRLCELSFAEFDPFQNTEQLRKVLQSLQEYYSDIRSSLEKGIFHLDLGVAALANEPEFRAYQILTHAEDQDVFRQALSFAKEVFVSQKVQFALRCVSALHQVDYVRYFGLTNEADYFQACLLHTHFVKFRRSALKMIGRAFLSKEALPVDALARWLFIEDLKELTELVESTTGGRMSTNQNGNLMVILTAASDMQTDSSTTNLALLSPVDTAISTKARMTRAIEAKVSGCPISSLIRSPWTNPTTNPILPNTLTYRIQPVLPFMKPSSAQVSSPSPPPPPPPPSLPLKKKHSSAMITEKSSELMTLNLLEWFKSVEVPKICQKSLFVEKERRNQLKACTIFRVLYFCWDSILQELCLEVTISSISSLRLAIKYESFRKEAIEKISKRLSKELFEQVISSECYSLLKAITFKPPPVAAAAPPPMVSANSPSSTSFADKRSSSTLTIDEHFFELNSLSNHVNALVETTSQERLESQLLEDLLNQAINS